MFHRLSRTACRSLLAATSLGILVLLLTHHNELRTPSFRFDSILGDLYGSSHEHDPDLIASSQLQNAKAQNFWLKLHSALYHANPQVNSIKPSRPHIEQSFNEIWPDLVHEELIRVSVEEKEQLRTNHQKFVDNLGEVGEFFPFTRGARGIVTTAGEKYVNALLVSLRVLRRVGSKLPVEVFFDAHTESTDRVCSGMLKKLNAECRFFSDIWIATPDTIYLKSFQWKVFALLFSSFEDVLFLDADAFPARNPDKLLHVEPYMSMGLVTWPDFWSTTTSPTFWEVAGVSDGVAKKEQDVRASTESGIILVSKDQHGSTLLLAAYYNYYGPGCYYPLLSQGAQGEGDKETFLHAAIALNTSFYNVRAGVAVIGDFVNDKWETIGMKQADPVDDYKKNTEVVVNATAVPMFVHHNIVKLDPEKLFEHPLVKMKEGEKGRRLWGTKANTVEDFGRDLEKVVWEEVKVVACEISPDLCRKAVHRIVEVYES